MSGAAEQRAERRGEAAVVAIGRPEVTILIHLSDPRADVDLLIDSYSKVLRRLGREGELLFILDGPTGPLLDRLEVEAGRRKNLKVLALQGGGNGESIAYTAGIEHARGRFLVTAGDYLQVDPQELGIHLAALEGGADLVCSWRHPRCDPWLNRLQSSFFNWFLRHVSKVPLHDLNCGFRSMRREVLEEISIYGDLFRFLPIMAKRRGFRVQEVKVRHLEERGKTGFFGIGVYLRRLLDILAVTFLTRFTQKPLRFFGIIGAVLILVGLLLAFPPFLDRVIGAGGLQDRPIFLMGVVFLAFGFQCIGFGLVGEIIIFTQSRNLKEYKIDRISSLGIEEVPDAGVEQDEDEPAPRILAIDEDEDVDEDEVLIRHVAPGEDPVLDLYAGSHDAGTVFHLEGWRRMCEDVLHRQGDVLVAERRGTVVGMLPYFNLRSLLLGRIAVSMPFAVQGGILADDQDAAAALLAEATRLSDEQGNRYLELRHAEPWPGPLEEGDLYVGFVRALPADPGACLGMIPRKARAECRKGVDAGLRLVEGCDLDVFHRLFAVNKQRLGSPIIPRTMLDALARRLGPERVVLHRVEDGGGKAIAAVLSFLHEGCILPYYSGGLPGHEGSGVNNFMYWRLMEWASGQGLRCFDFGRSRRDTGPARFKKNMGFEPTPMHYQYHLGPHGSLPTLHPGNPRLGLFQVLWRTLPRPLAIWIGQPLFRQLA
ncbi:MAG: FemAB family PEP-CTERM system-associated protein [Planctomycetota bacterium]